MISVMAKRRIQALSKSGDGHFPFPEPDHYSIGFHVRQVARIGEEKKAVIHKLFVHPMIRKAFASSLASVPQGRSGSSFDRAER
jgi:hypothetical protein